MIVGGVCFDSIGVGGVGVAVVFGGRGGGGGVGHCCLLY